VLDVRFTSLPRSPPSMRLSSTLFSPRSTIHALLHVAHMSCMRQTCFYFLGLLWQILSSSTPTPFDLYMWCPFWCMETSRSRPLLILSFVLFTIQFLKGTQLLLVMFSFVLFSSFRCESRTKINISTFSCTYNISLWVVTISSAGSILTRLLYHKNFPGLWKDLFWIFVEDVINFFFKYALVSSHLLKKRKGNGNW
jgi:hypothetical protein